MCHRYAPSARRIRDSIGRGTPSPRVSFHWSNMLSRSLGWIKRSHDHPVKSLALSPEYSAARALTWVRAPSSPAVQTI